MNETPAILRSQEAPAPAAIWRLPTVQSHTGYSKTKVYDQIGDGLFPKPIKIGRRASGWPSDEVETVIAARIAEQSEDNIRRIVQRMYEKRVERLRALLEAQT